MTQKPDQFAQYMLSEFQTLHLRAQQNEQVITSKINFFVTGTAALGAGILAASNSDYLVPIFLPLALVLLLFITVFGVATFLQILDLSAARTFFYRRCGRIRRWFCDTYDCETNYLPIRATDSQPSFFERREGLRGVEAGLVLINAAAGAGFMGLLLYSAAMSLPVSTLVGLVFFLVIIITHRLYMRWYLSGIEKDETAKGHVHFPG